MEFPLLAVPLQNTGKNLTLDHYITECSEYPDVKKGRVHCSTAPQLNS